MQLLVNHYIEMSIRQNRSKYGKNPNARQLRKIRMFIEEGLENPHHYHTYSVENGSIKKMIHAWKTVDPFGVPSLQVDPFYFDKEYANEKNILSEIVKLKKFVGNEEEKLSVRLFDDQPSIIQFLNQFCMVPESFEFIGNICESLELIKQKLPKNSDQFLLEPANFDRDINSILDLIKRSHRDETTSIENFKTVLSLDIMKNFYRECSEKQTAFILKDGEKIIGEFCLSPDFEPQAGLIGSITIDPDYKGQGLSWLLLQKVCKILNEHKNSYYIGYTTTDKLLEVQKKLKSAIQIHKMKLPLDTAESLKGWKIGA